MPSRLVIIPTYNESSNIEELLRRLFKYIPDISVLVIDDNSPDGTSELCHRLQNQYPELHTYRRDMKLGLGSAYRLGFAWGLERGFLELIEMDADHSHRVRDLAAMLDVHMKDPRIGLVIGSRWIPGGAIINWPRRRELLSRTANRYVQLMLGTSVKDSTSGFRIYSAETLRAIDLHKIRSEGYSFQIEMTRAVIEAGKTIREVPITFRERENGVSKMSTSIVREALLMVTTWGLKRFIKR